MPSYLSTTYIQEHLDEINQDLESKSPQEVLQWALDNLEGLFQTTSFGLSGLAALDMMSKLTENTPPLIFVDTTYHFAETLALAKEASSRYRTKLHTYSPPGALTSGQFEGLYGSELWKRDPQSYGYLTKVEPARRSYEELGVQAVITGRRKSQGAERSSLLTVEVDETGLVKVNPLASWTFSQVKEYIDANQVPYNPLLDRGYKSIGDWHSTAAVDGSLAEDAAERSGRWQGSEKTECGLHEDYFKMRRAFKKKQREAEMALRDQHRLEEESPVTVAS